jgi:hypothetical protein
MSWFPGRALPLKILGTSLLILFASLAGGCQVAPVCKDPAGCILPNRAGKFVLGIEVATVGDPVDSSHQLRDALAALLGAPGADGPSTILEVQTFESDCSEASRAQRAAQIAATPGLVALVGPACLETDSAYFKLLSDAGISVISPSLLPQSAKFPGIYTAFPPLAEQAQTMAVLLSQVTPAGDIRVFSQEAYPYPDFATLLCQALGQVQRKCGLSVPLADLEAGGGALTLKNSPAILLLPFSSLGSLPDLPPPSSQVYLADPLVELFPADLSLPGSAILFQNNFAGNSPDNFTSRQAHRLYTIFQQLFISRVPGISVQQDNIGRMAMRKRLDSLSGSGLQPGPFICKPAQACPLPETAFTVYLYTH